MKLQTGGAGTGTVTNVSSATGDATVANPTTSPVITVVSAPKLTTARTINGVNFDGSANITIHGILTAGTSGGMNPIVLGTITSVGHGLGATPTFGVIAYMECLNADVGYLAGARIYISGHQDAVQSGIEILADANVTDVIISNTAVHIINPATFVSAAIAVAKWKVVVTPYNIS